MRLLFIFLSYMNLHSYDTLVLIDKNLHETLFTTNYENEILKIVKEIDSRCYYKSGVVDKSSCYIPTGNIIVSFDRSAEIDYALFAVQNGLLFLKELNPYAKSALFKIGTQVDPLTKVNQLNRDEIIIKADVEWIKPRRLF